MARDALDVGGHGVLMVDAHGPHRLAFAAGARWLAEFFGDARRAPPAAAAALAEAHDRRSGRTRRRRPHAGGAPALAPPASARRCWLLALQQDRRRPAPRGWPTAALTPRETEVLSWVAKGKTNRDIGDILGMSPRTVNKHLEHVFEKLGVETRTAAAALASRELG